MKLFSLYKTELKNSLNWHIGWIISLIFCLGLLIIIYPGDKAMNEFMPLLDTALLGAFIGNIGGSSPSYTLWVAILIPMMTIAYFLYGILTGVRVVVQSITDQTGELIHTYPISRNNFLFIRMIVPFLPFFIFNISQFILLGIKVIGFSIEYNKLITITWTGILYLICSMLFGMVIGLIAGNKGRGYQYSVLFVLLLYFVQIIGRIQPEYTDINNFNPLNFYQPETVLLFNSMKEGNIFSFNFPIFPVYNLISIFFLILFSFYEFNRKDLSDEAGFHFRSIMNFTIKKNILFPIFFIWRQLKGLLVPKQIKNNPFVFWVRIFEKRLPLTADFIYSDNITLLIIFIALLAMFPFQLALYPGDELMKKSIVGFVGNPIFLTITYGINLSSQPYLWFLISQELGVLWTVLMPLCFYWVRKAIVKDGDSLTGEILGSVPTHPRIIVLQRIFAILIELIYITFWMIIFVIFSELINQKTSNLAWEIIAILCLIPFYSFLIFLMVAINLLFRNYGGLFSGLFLAGMMLSYLISVLNSNLDVWFVRGIFPLYNPVLIISEKSILVSNYGMVILSITALFFALVAIYLSSRFTWLNIKETKSINK